MTVEEQRLQALGIHFQPTSHKGRGVAAYRIEGELLFIGGVTPVGEDGKPAYAGRVGAEYSTEQGYRAARLTALHMLQIIVDALGSLDRVDFVVKVFAAVSVTPGFGEIYRVADGFSDALTEVLGERGLHARNAVGASTLQGNAPIVCDAIVKIRN